MSQTLTDILVVIAAVFLVWLVIRLFRKPIRWILKLLLNTAIGFAALFLLNFFGSASASRSASTGSTRSSSAWPVSRGWCCCCSSNISFSLHKRFPASEDAGNCFIRACRCSASAPAMCRYHYNSRA